MSDPVYQGSSRPAAPGLPGRGGVGDLGHRPGTWRRVPVAYTGGGAHVPTIDDPIKNAEEAASAICARSRGEVHVDGVHRLAPGGGVLIIPDPVV